MAKYKKEKNLEFQLEGNDPVKIEVIGQYGSIGNVSWKHDQIRKVVVNAGEKNLSEDVVSKGDSIYFSGKLRNPDGGKCSAKNIISQSAGNQLVYDFPADYDDTPKYDSSETSLSYSFTVNFI